MLRITEQSEHLKQLALLFALIFTLMLPTTLLAGGVYQEPDAFIEEVFDGAPPKPSVIWLNKELKQRLEDILAHSYKGLRIRYWKDENKSAWILDEIGKEKPITTGFVIKDGKIERVKILVFRESRGWEVRHAFFTDQFKQAALIEDNELDTTIDNVSGATLSVRAVTKLAKIALLLDAKVNTQKS
jgi:hypothetical protein